MFANTFAAVFGLASMAVAQDPTYFITFGDSYSQTGFDITGEAPSTSNPLGNPPLPGWTSSGGLNWIGHLLTNSPNVLSYNFAYGGATVDSEIVAPYDPSVLSLIDQVQIFSDNVAGHPEWIAEETIVGVWIGVNDVGNSWYLENSSEVNSDAVGRLFEQLQVIYDAGLRQFALLTVPPTDKTPALAEGGEPLIAALADFNANVESSLATFSTANEGVTAQIIDTALPFNTAIEDPAEYGAPDATCFNEDGVSCLWHDDYHPGIEIHGLVAAQVAATWGGPFVCVDSVLCS